MKFLFLLLIASPVFAKIPEYTQLRQQNAANLAFLKSIPIAKCSLVQDQSPQLYSKLSSIEQALFELATALGSKRSERVLQIAGLAKQQSLGLNVDCLNKTRNSVILLEMYLVNMDTEMMILEYGVGADLRRK